MKGRKPQSSRLKKAFLTAVAVLGIGGMTGGIETLDKDPLTDTQSVTTFNTGTSAQYGYNISPIDQMWKATLNMRDIDGLSKDMIDAGTKGDSWRVQALLDNGNLGIYSAATHDAFSAAALQGNRDVVDVLLKAGIDPAANDGMALLSAVRGKNNAIAYMLMDRGVSGASQDSGALVSATFQNDVAMIDALLKRGADAKADNSSAMKWAATLGHTDALSTLITAGADVTADDNAAMRAAADAGQVDAMKQLLRAGGSVAANDGEALRLAAANGHIDAVKLILDQKTSYTLNMHDFVGPFSGSGYNRYSLDGGLTSPANYSDFTYSVTTVNINAQDGAALNAAVNSNNLDMVRTLLDAGASATGSNGAPLQNAIFNNDFNMASLLISKGADVNAGNGSALYMATTMGNVQMAQMLLSNKADPNARDGVFKKMAKEAGNKDLQQVLDGKAPTSPQPLPPGI